MSSPVVLEMVTDVEEFCDAEGLEQVRGLLDDLASLAETAPPTPNDRLARLLAGGRTADTAVPARSRSRAARATRRERAAVPHRGHRRVVAGLAAAAVASLTLTGVAAVANELPPGMQRAVAHFSEAYLPFQVPRPAGDPPAPQQSGGSQGTRSTGDGSSTAPRSARASEDAAKHGARRSAPGTHPAGAGSSEVASGHGRTSTGNGLGAGAPTTPGNGSGSGNGNGNGTGNGTGGAVVDPAPGDTDTGTDTGAAPGAPPVGDPTTGPRVGQGKPGNGGVGNGKGQGAGQGGGQDGDSGQGKGQGGDAGGSKGGTDGTGKGTGKGSGGGSGGSDTDGSATG